MICITSFVQITQPGAIVYNRAPATINWMVPAVLVFLFCCWPLGLIAINAASNVNIKQWSYFIVHTSEKYVQHMKQIIYFWVINIPCNVIEKRILFSLLLLNFRDLISFPSITLRIKRAST